eukprot:Skav225662  [mRNA]  locus=scaffold1924:24736:29585:+ [translate_table: standard]
MHSEGEFCEEADFIEASIRHKASHWPRLFVGIPFTPHRGRRLITAAWLSADERAKVRANVGINVGFPTEEEGRSLVEHGFIQKKSTFTFDMQLAYQHGLSGQGSQGRQKTEDVVIFEGTFSWWAAWCMMIWVPSDDDVLLVLMILSTRGSAFQIISEEISKDEALFYSLAGSSLGLFTVSYFTSFVLLEDRNGNDQGPKRVVDIGFLISKGVNVYMGRTIPVILALLFLGGWYVFTTAGSRAVACFAVGAVLNLEDRKERAKHGLEEDDHNLVAELVQMEAGEWILEIVLAHACSQ